jgi:hypothetical protein
MHVEKVKYVLWAADWQRCLKFYRELHDDAEAALRKNCRPV